MSDCCKKCGAKISGCICLNCEKELYIYSHSVDEAEFSPEFMEKITAQLKGFNERFKKYVQELDRQF